ncbi:MAG TPA: hypothetical protein VIS09_19120 [Streptomyces sp.]
MARHPEVRAAVEEGVAKGNGRPARVEHVRDFTVLPMFWEANGDELTAMMKVRRKVVTEKYAKEIEALCVRPEHRGAPARSLRDRAERGILRRAAGGGCLRRTVPVRAPLSSGSTRRIMNTADAHSPSPDQDDRADFDGATRGLVDRFVPCVIPQQPRSPRLGQRPRWGFLEQDCQDTVPVSSRPRPDTTRSKLDSSPRSAR